MTTPSAAPSAMPEPLPLPEPIEVTSSDGTRIAAYDLGGDGDDVLMVHATGFCAGVWLPVARPLKDPEMAVESPRIAALDVRGHGRSAVPSSGMDWWGTAHDVLATIDALGLERPFGVGHSMGGASLVLAELLRPGTFRGMWIYEPIIGLEEIIGPHHDGGPLASGAERRRSRFDSRDAAFANFAGKAPFDVLDQRSLAAYVAYGFDVTEDGSAVLRCEPKVEAATYRMGSRHGAAARLAEISCPVTVACGGEEFGPAGLAPSIAERLPNGRLERHPDLGHFGPLQDPDGIAESVGFAVTAST